MALTCNQELTQRTETELTIKWVSNQTIDHVWYSLNNGSSWTGFDVTPATNGSYTIENLTANTTYQVITSVRPKSNHSTYKNSAMQNMTTFNYPYAKTMPNFIIGEKLTVSLYNPLNRTVTVVMQDSNNNTLVTKNNVTGTSTRGFDAPSSVDALYNSIPNSVSGTYKIKVTYDGHDEQRTGGTYSINKNVALPLIGELLPPVAYNNPAGFTSVIIQNISDVVFQVNGVTGYKGSTISSVTVKVLSTTQSLTATATAGQYNNLNNKIKIDSAANVDALFTVTDSRGQKATKTRAVTVYEYFYPTAECSAARRENFYDETTLTVNPRIADIGDRNEPRVQYRYYSNPVPLPAWTDLSGTTATLTLDNQKDWFIDVRVTDDFDYSYEGQHYWTQTLFVQKGMPIMFIDRKLFAVGFNCFPDAQYGLSVKTPDYKNYAGEAINIAPLIPQIYYDMMFQPGEYEYGGTNGEKRLLMPGMITTNATEIYFTWILDKSIGELDFSVDWCNIYVRCNGTYLISGADIMSSYTTEVKAASDNALTFKVSKTDGTAFSGALNNSPVSVSIESAGLTFTRGGD